MDSLKESLEALNAYKDKTRLLLLPFTLFVVIAAGMAFILKMIGPAFVILILDMIFYFLVIHRMTKRYGFMVNEANLKYGFFKPLKNVSTKSKDGMDFDDFVNLSMFPIKNGKNTLLSRNSVFGEREDEQLEAHELTFHYVIADAKGKPSHQFVSGSLFMDSFKKTGFKGDYLLLRRDVLETGAKTQFVSKNGYKAFALKDQTLTEGFDGYYHGEENFTAQLEALCLKLGSQAKNLCAIRIMDGKAAIFLTRRFYAGSRYTTTEPTKEILSKNYFSERDEIFSFFKNLKLYEKENTL